LPQGADRDSWFRFISELITDLWAQHPIGRGYLRTTGKSNNQNYRVTSPQLADNFNFHATERAFLRSESGTVIIGYLQLIAKFSAQLDNA
jgi:hypothetical protein